jgi:hypothetical protein
MYVNNLVPRLICKISKNFAFSFTSPLYPQKVDGPKTKQRETKSTFHIVIAFTRTRT